VGALAYLSLLPLAFAVVALIASSRKDKNRAKVQRLEREMASLRAEIEVPVEVTVPVTLPPPVIAIVGLAAVAVVILVVNLGLR
jgi:hypothetical protein